MTLTTTTVEPEVLAAAATIAVPRAAPADSFVLHAPLELLARVGLLPLVDPAEHDRAVQGITGLAVAFEATGPGVAPPAELHAGSLHDAARMLDAALRKGDPDGADAALVWIAERADHATARHLVAESIVDSLAAAGHAPIGLHLLPRVAGGELPASLLRGAVRTIAGQPSWRLDWFRNETAVAPGERVPMSAALAAVPWLGRPGSDFIYPLMSQVQDRGIAAQLLAPTLADGFDLDAGSRALMRAAAWSMLHDDPNQAPYGWSHCLTMPQAVLSLAGDGVDPRTAMAVAATYVVGFRAAHGMVELGSLADADGTPAGGAGTPDLTDLATFAALHHDAHLVKYTLACIHAAEADPAWAGTYLEAAAHLADWWWQHPDAA